MGFLYDILVCLELDVSPCIGILFPFCSQESDISPCIGILLPCLWFLFGVGYKSMYWHSVSFLLFGVGCKSMNWHSVSF